MSSLVIDLWHRALEVHKVATDDVVQRAFQVMAAGSLMFVWKSVIDLASGNASAYIYFATHSPR